MLAELRRTGKSRSKLRRPIAGERRLKKILIETACPAPHSFSSSRETYEPAARRSMQARYAAAPGISERSAHKEKNMERAGLIFFTLVFATAAASAQGGPSVRNGAPSLDSRYSAMDGQALHPAPSGERIIRNANDCAPDKAEPVWGADSSLLGYSCVAPSANGS